MTSEFRFQLASLDGTVKISSENTSDMNMKIVAPLSLNSTKLNEKKAPVTENATSILE